ncbi:MAG: BlaI/MecI/CopY family transcriptional regulator [Lachnospiraceae bacterium]|nr:BlaI/MecI/CopY family transcriptional regulator [Lachnospiraceae bacterium]
MENNMQIKLPDSELEIMQAIWALNAAGERFVSAQLIVNRYPVIARLKMSTILTLITRLQTKGFIETAKLGRANCYTPLVSIEDYRRFVTKDFLSRVFCGDREALKELLSDTAN